MTDIVITDVYIENLCVFYFYRLIGKLIDFFIFRSSVCTIYQKSKVGNILGKAAGLCITLNIDGVTIVSRSHRSHSLKLLVY